MARPRSVLALGLLATCSSAPSPFSTLSGAGAFDANSFIALYQGTLPDGGVGPDVLEIELFESFPKPLTCSSLSGAISGGYGRSIVLRLDTFGPAIQPGTYPVVSLLGGGIGDGGIATVDYANADAGGYLLPEASGVSGQVTITAVGAEIEGTFDTQLAAADAGSSVAGDLSGSFRATVCGPVF